MYIYIYTCVKLYMYLINIYNYKSINNKRDSID